MMIYKYLNSDRIDVLRNSRIRFTQPAALNDPFEFYPCWEKVQKAIVERVFDKIQVACDPLNPIHKLMMIIMNVYLKQQIAATANNGVLVLSLSKKHNNSIMWSHYTSSHKGFVIGFDSESEFFQGRDKLTEVRYSKSRYVVPANAFRNLEIPSELGEQLLGAICFTKSSDWQYEEELRLLADCENADHVLDKDSELPIYLFNFPEEIVKEVIIGYKIDPDFRRDLLGICENKYPHANIFYAIPNSRSYDLTIVPYAGKQT